MVFRWAYKGYDKHRAEILSSSVSTDCFLMCLYAFKCEGLYPDMDKFGMKRLNQPIGLYFFMFSHRHTSFSPKYFSDLFLASCSLLMYKYILYIYFWQFKHCFVNHTITPVYKPPNWHSPFAKSIAKMWPSPLVASCQVTLHYWLLRCRGFAFDII